MDYSKAIKLLQSRLDSLKNQLQHEKRLREEFEEKLRSAEVTSQRVIKELEDKDAQMEHLLEGNKELLVQIERIQREKKEVDENCEKCQKELDLMEISRNDLEQALGECHRKLEELLKRDEEARDHVRESLNVIEAAIMEKDHALIREQEVRGESFKF